MNYSTMHAIGKWLLASSVAVYLLSSLPSSAHELQRLFLLTPTTATREVPDFSHWGYYQSRSRNTGEAYGGSRRWWNPVRKPASLGLPNAKEWPKKTFEELGFASAGLTCGLLVFVYLWKKLDHSGSWLLHQRLPNGSRIKYIKKWYGWVNEPKYYRRRGKRKAWKGSIS